MKTTNEEVKEYIQEMKDDFKKMEINTYEQYERAYQTTLNEFQEMGKDALEKDYFTAEQWAEIEEAFTEIMEEIDKKGEGTRDKWTRTSMTII